MIVAKVRIKSLPEGCWLEEQIQEITNDYIYHKDQMEKHKIKMEQAEKRMKETEEFYKKRYEDIAKFLQDNPDRNQKMREFGHNTPIVEDI